MRPLILSFWLLATMGAIGVLVRLIARGLWRVHWGLVGFLGCTAVRATISAPMLLIPAWQPLYRRIWLETQWLSDLSMMLMAAGVLWATARLFPRPTRAAAVAAVPLASIAWAGSSVIGNIGASQWHTETARAVLHGRNFAVALLIFIAGVQLIAGVLRPLAPNVRRLMLGTEIYFATKLLTLGLQHAAGNDPQWNGAVMLLSYALSFLYLSYWWAMEPRGDIAPLLDYLPTDQIVSQQRDLARRIRRS